MSVITPSPRLRALRARLEVSIAKEAPITPDDLFSFIVEGYEQAVQRAHLRQDYATIHITAGQAQYSTPGDLYEVIGVYMNGSRLVALPSRESFTEAAGFYQETGIIGFPLTPSGDGTMILHYATRPPALTSWDATPIQAFGAEWDHLLWKYAAWRILTLGGGSQDIAYAEAQRQQYEAGILSLAERASHRSHAAPMRVAHVLEVGRAS